MKNLRSLTLLVILCLVVILPLFQNCAEVRLQRASPPSTVIESAVTYDTTQLRPPIYGPKRSRVFIVVDQSFSMIYGKCAGELDSDPSNPVSTDGKLTGCTRAPGADPEADRFKIIRNWYRELATERDVAIAAGLTTPEPVQVALIPFSGGIRQRPKTGEAPKHALRIPTDESYITELETEQEADRAKIAADVDAVADHMGTTSPLVPLQTARAAIQSEIDRLKQARILDKTTIRFVFLTDGAIKPLNEMYERGREALGCPTSAQCASAPSTLGCVGANEAGWENPRPSEVCNQLYPDRFRRTFGEWTSNTYDGIKAEIQRIKDLPTLPGNQGATVSVSLAQIRPNRLDQRDGDLPAGGVRNLFPKVSNDLELDYFRIDGPQAPFSLKSGGKILNFEINSFYVMNLNTFVNGVGDLDLDSDGDGLTDAAEIQLRAEANPIENFDPYKARTNSFCLDSITANYGCLKLGCDYRLDQDGDGLNECEEKTMGTDANKMDMDEDGIIDLHEILRGMNPRKNQTGEVRQDDWTEMMRFAAGLLPISPRQTLLPTAMIRVQVRRLGYGQYPGSDAITAKYNFVLENLPLKNVPATPDPNWAAMTRPDPTEYPLEVRTLDKNGFAMGALPEPRQGINQILIMLKVGARENPSITYWMGRRIEVPFAQGGTQSFTINDLSGFKRLQYLQNGGGAL